MRGRSSGLFRPVQTFSGFGSEEAREGGDEVEDRVDDAEGAAGRHGELVALTEGREPEDVRDPAQEPAVHRVGVDVEHEKRREKRDRDVQALKRF